MKNSLNGKTLDDKELELIVGGGDSSVREKTAGKEEMQIHS